MERKLIVHNLLIFILIAIFWAGCESDTILTAPDRSSSSDTAITAAVGDRGMRSSDFRSRNQGMGGHFAEVLITTESGGVMNFRNGDLQVQPHSIDETKMVWVTTYSMVRGNFFKKIYDFGPSGTVFDPPAILTLNYCDLGPLMPDSLDLLVFNETSNQWEVASNMVNNPSEKSFSGPISHFSRYSLSGNGQVLKPKLSQ